MNVLSQISQRTFLLLMVGIVLLMLTCTSAYGIWPQIKEINEEFSTREELRDLVSSKQQLDKKQLGLNKQVELLKRSLKGDMADLPENKMESFIIGELQNISWNHNIELIGVKPAKGNEIQMFQEILFNVRLTGEYFDLYSWLKNLRSQLGFVVIKNLELNLKGNDSNDNKIHMKLTIASYKSM